MARIAAIFHAPMGETASEQFVAGGRLAATTDLIHALRSWVDEILVVANDNEAALFRTLDVRLISSPLDVPFHFGRALQALAHDYKIEELLYFGSGSGGLLNQSSIESLIEFAEHCQRGALFNNFYSCDFAVVTSASSLLEARLPSNDNGLGFALSDAGIPCFSLPRSIETAFDIDTPTDLLLLRASDRGGKSLRRFLEASALPSYESVDELCGCLVDRNALVHLFGRINPTVWGQFEQQVACRTTGVIEGRGMRATGASHTYPHHDLLRGIGPAAFFDRLSEAVDAAILDTRPLLVEAGFLPPASDRFASDLLLDREIVDPDWKAFTRAAANASIPVLLGGHSLVSGGLYLLAEIAWKGRQLDRRLHPEPFFGRNGQT